MQILTIAGRVGKDPELRHTQSGDAVLNFTIAVDNGKDKDGNKRDPSWFDCSLWGKRANSLQPYISKGDALTVTGRPTARAYNEKAYLGINVSDLTFMGGGQKSGAGREPDYGQDSRTQEGFAAPDLDDDLPF